MLSSNVGRLIAAGCAVRKGSHRKSAVLIVAGDYGRKARADVAIRRKALQTVLNGSGGAIWSHSIGVFYFSDKDLCAGEGLAIPAVCGNGHPLSAENLRIDDREARWRCRQCGRERAASFRGRRKTAA
jgi:hypothetical protein